MSLYLHLVCLDHNPPLVAEMESGQHLYDLPRIRREVADRAEMVRDQDGLDAGVPWNAPADQFFRLNSARFLAAHPTCHIGIRDEYGVDYPIEEPTS